MGLKPSAKKNKKITVGETMTNFLLNEESPQKGKAQSVNEMFFRDKGKQRIDPKGFVEWGSVGFVANTWTKSDKMEIKCTTMIFLFRALNHSSGTCKLRNPTTGSIVVKDSVQ